ncbi:MAG TPA: hypothetical protein VGP27_22465 [Mycobacterium sp.]|nr:hypothetical protein [Mycobacterium sp.]
MFCNALIFAPAWIAGDAAVCRNSWSLKPYTVVCSPAASTIVRGYSSAAATACDHLSTARTATTMSTVPLTATVTQVVSV